MELQNFWLNIPNNAIGRSWFPPTRTAIITIDLVTDASKFGWGAHFPQHYYDISILKDTPNAIHGKFPRSPAQGALPLNPN